MLTVKKDNDITLFRDYFNQFKLGFDQVFADFMSDMGLQYSENEDHTLTYSVDVPGIKEEDLTVEVSDYTVNIKGMRKTNKSEYSVKKSFLIPKNYNPESLKAKLADGVLTITIEPKTETEKITRKIDISR